MFINFPPANDVVSIRAGEMLLPKIRKIKQVYNSDKVEDINAYMNMRFERLQVDRSWYPGKRIAITVGSRGIPNLDVVVRTIVDQLKSWGAEPFVIPAMGSHGGGTAEGQREVLKNYGITEENIGAPVISSMEVVEYGKLKNGGAIYCDKNAAEADGIVLMNKVKPHTDFRGEHESGIGKMIAIGIAKFEGATAFHSQGFSHFAEFIPEVSDIFLNKFNVCFSVGLVQNAYDDVCEIEIANSKDTMEMDARLLRLAKERIAQFKFKELDVLVIDQIGKEISGYGQDPNVTGRVNRRGGEGFSDILHLNKMVILGLTEKTHHNGAGIAEADITTRRCLNDIDWGPTWTNLIASTEIQGAKIPLYAESERDAVKIAMAACGVIPSEQFRIARIKNTLMLGEIEVSEALYQDIKDRSDIVALSEPYDWTFDEEGNFINE